MATSFISRPAVISRLAVAGVLGLALTLSGCTALFPSSAPPATDSETGEEIEQTDTDVFSLTVGQCLNDTSGTEVSEVPIVDCADEHDFEVYADFEIDGDEFPGDFGVAVGAAELADRLAIPGQAEPGEAIHQRHDGGFG